MQAQNNNIQTFSFGCRLNALETEKIRDMLAPLFRAAIVVNTCAVTHEAERQSGQFVRRLARENPNVPIFVTGCAATRNAQLFARVPGVAVIDNADKMRADAYVNAAAPVVDVNQAATTDGTVTRGETLSKKFVQIQNGCNHKCTYCVTRLLRGPAVSFEYDDILREVRDAVADGYNEVVLTGVDIASYARVRDGAPFLISDLCAALLRDVPGLRRLRLSSMDPASPQLKKIVALMRADSRMMGHLHLSMQSGSDTILSAMLRRHNSAGVRELVAASEGVSFSWDIICGFPGETDELFAETMNLARELGVIKIHAFPFSPRPGTVAATMPDQVDRAVARRRVHEITRVADENMAAFMRGQIGRRVQVLVEENNMARTPDDIAVKIEGAAPSARSVCDVNIIGISGLQFIGKVC